MDCFPRLQRFEIRVEIPARLFHHVLRRMTRKSLGEIVRMVGYGKQTEQSQIGWKFPGIERVVKRRLFLLDLGKIRVSLAFGFQLKRMEVCLAFRGEDLAKLKKSGIVDVLAFLAYVHTIWIEGMVSFDDDSIDSIGHGLTPLLSSSIVT